MRFAIQFDDRRLINRVGGQMRYERQQKRERPPEFLDRYRFAYAWNDGEVEIPYQNSPSFIINFEYPRSYHQPILQRLVLLSGG